MDRYDRGVTERTSILFLMSEPSDTTKLRLHEELHDIHTRLQLSDQSEQFNLYHRNSVRPEDLSQAIFDTRPTIVHFSGHGASSDRLLLEDDSGRPHPVAPHALEALFALCKSHVRCVILNACYSNAQAHAISRQIDFVIGMRHTITDKAAIAFSAGFYKALGVGRPIRECFEFGLVELKLYNIPEHHTPVLLERPSQSYILLEETDFITEKLDRLNYQWPLSYSAFTKLIFEHDSKQGCILIDPNAYRCIGNLLDDIYINYLHKHVDAFSYGSQWMILASWWNGVLIAPWKWAISDLIENTTIQTDLLPDRTFAPKIAHLQRDVDKSRSWLEQQSDELLFWKRKSPPVSVGLTRGSLGRIVFAHEIPRFEECVILASNNEFINEIVLASYKGVLRLAYSLFCEIPSHEFNNADYRYILMIHAPRIGGKIFVDSGCDLGSEMLYWTR